MRGLYSVTKERQQMGKNVTFTFDLDEKAHAKIKKEADENHRTLAGQLRYMIDLWLEKGE